MNDELKIKNFKKFLRMHNAYEAFVENFKEDNMSSNNDRTIRNVYTGITDYFNHIVKDRDYPAYKLIMSSGFVFAYSKEGSEYWQDLYSKWCSLVDGNFICFTDREREYLMNMIPNTPITNKRILNKLQAYGHVVLHHHTGKRVTTPFGTTVTAWYVNECNSVDVIGVGSFYATYHSGSLFPYVYFSKNETL